MNNLSKNLIFQKMKMSNFLLNIIALKITIRIYFIKNLIKILNDIGKGEIKCIVKLSDTEEIEVGLPENSTIEDLKLKLFNYYDHLKRPFKLIPLDHIKYSYVQITYSPDKILIFSVDLS
jgi:hypothetical protein